MSNTEIIFETIRDPISEVLQMTPIPQKYDIIAVKKDNDYESAKENMHSVIEVGTAALSQLANIADASQDPRVYRVLTELLSAMVTANRELVEIKRVNVETEIKQRRPNDDDESKTVNNLFVGSTAELTKMLEQMKK